MKPKLDKNGDPLPTLYRCHDGRCGATDCHRCEPDRAQEWGAPAEESPTNQHHAYH
jgi:hypothetical protein